MTVEEGVAAYQPALQLVILITVGLLAIVGLGVPKIKLHALETRAIGRIGLVAIVLAVTSILIDALIHDIGPISIGLTFGAVFFVLALGARMLALFLLLGLRERGLSREPIAIYGAGSAGMRIASELNHSHDLRPVVFVDDSPQMQGMIVCGLPVRSPRVLESLVKRDKIKRIILAIPSAPVTRQEALMEDLSKHGCEVDVIPSMADLVRQTGLEAAAKAITPADLIKRQKVNLDNPRVARAYANRVVLITGAGGSIGSELCHQLIECAPRKIVLFEHSEYNLYRTQMELEPLAKASEIELCPRLGSVTDRAKVRQVIEDEKVDFILHAAAYKHVPMLEMNEASAAMNNVIGTRIVAEEAARAEVRRFILVSTDKAVRPVSVMGATKKLAEMAVQDVQANCPTTKFAMVRFGNVLGSSGSVLPLFQQQIAARGPVTVTHPEMSRYFMTIPEAARLVLLAGAFADGDDVFVLDMGEPIKIIDIARRLIELSGYTVREDGQEGDIEIQVIGTRPGEKLHEELFLDTSAILETPHDKIHRVKEERPASRMVNAMIAELTAAIKEADNPAVREILCELLPDFNQKEQSNVVPVDFSQTARR